MLKASPQERLFAFNTQPEEKFTRQSAAEAGLRPKVPNEIKLQSVGLFSFVLDGGEVYRTEKKSVPKER